MACLKRFALQEHHIGFEKSAAALFLCFSFCSVCLKIKNNKTLINTDRDDYIYLAPDRS